MADQSARRFYTEAAAAPVEHGFRIELDGRPVKTPAGTLLEVPAKGLAAAIAAEWQAQEETVDPSSMPMMQLACTALDRVAPNRDAIVDETVAYGASDLLCYRADTPDDLVQLQTENWQPVLDWLASEQSAALAVTAGIVHVDQPQEAIDALRDAVTGFDVFPLTAVTRLTQVFGSLALALAVAEAHLTWEEGTRLAFLDETYQAEKWGEDREAMDRRRNVTEEAGHAARFLDLVTG